MYSIPYTYNNILICCYIDYIIAITDVSNDHLNYNKCDIFLNETYNIINMIPTDC